MLHQTTSTETKRKTAFNAGQSRRHATVCYYLSGENNDARHRICKKFFLKTLDISDNVVRKCIHHGAAGVVVRKMPHVTPNATKKDKLDEVKAHINRYPRIESHYCRQSTKFEYLETGLSTSEMYRAYSSTTINPVSMNIYRKVFNGMKPPLKFHKPIKDQCDKCMAFEYKTEGRNRD